MAALRPYRWPTVLAALLFVACRPPATLGEAAPVRAARADSVARAVVRLERERALTPAGPRTVAVVPLQVASTDTALVPLGYGLADLLLADLARSRQLTVVERVQSDALLRELSLDVRGGVDSVSAARVGRLLGARRLIVGSLAASRVDTTATANNNARRLQELRIDARVADVETGTVDRGLAASAPVDRIIDAQKALVFRVFDLLGVALTPAERAAIERRPTRDLGALLAYSRGVRAEAQRDFTRAAEEYEQAVRADPGFAQARTHLGALRTSAGGGSVAQAAAIAIDNVNATDASVLRTAADAPISAAQQTVPITIRIRIP